MRELMIALIVACTLLSVAEAFYKDGDRWTSYRSAPSMKKFPSELVPLP
jgi:hypothetical protein